MLQKERRCYSRIAFEADALIIQDCVSYKAELVDVSLNGLLVKTPALYAIHKDLPCAAHIVLSNDTEIHMQVQLMHCQGLSLGFHCLNMDIDSMVHLRRLLEVNLDEPNAAERVLSELVRRYKSA